MGRVWIGVRERTEHLQRLSVVFAAPIRLRIVMELYQREMSPSEFFKEFGGGSRTSVWRHFERLREAGWLRRVHSHAKGKSGPPEILYRATELAFVDKETFQVLPESIRIAVCWHGYIEICEQLRTAMEASTFYARPDRRLTGTRLLLDEEGIARVGDAVAREFAAQFEEQEDARRRAANTGVPLFRAASILLACEAPLVEGQRIGSVLVASELPDIPFTVRLSKVFEDEVCMQLVDEAHRDDLSIIAFHKKYGERFGLGEQIVRRRAAKLVKYYWLTQVGEKTGGRRRGSVEKFYRPTGPALYDDTDAPWADPPSAFDDSEDWKTFLQITDWMKAAMAAGTVTRRDETCLAWSILQLDQRGWRRILASLQRLHTFIQKEQESAERRLKKTNDEPLAMLIGLGAFETPKPRKDDWPK